MLWESLRSELISRLNAIIHAKHGVGVKIGPTFNVLKLSENCCDTFRKNGENAFWNTNFSFKFEGKKSCQSCNLPRQFGTIPSRTVTKQKIQRTFLPPPRSTMFEISLKKSQYKNQFCPKIRVKRNWDFFLGHFPKLFFVSHYSRLSFFPFLIAFEFQPFSM